MRVGVPSADEAAPRVPDFDELAWLESEGYIEPVRNDTIRLTDRGVLLCDAVTARLMLDGPNGDL